MGAAGAADAGPHPRPPRPQRPPPQPVRRQPPADMVKANQESLTKRTDRGDELPASKARIHGRHQIGMPGRLHRTRHFASTISIAVVASETLSQSSARSSLLNCLPRSKGWSNPGTWRKQPHLPSGNSLTVTLLSSTISNPPSRIVFSLVAEAFTDASTSVL